MRARWTSILCLLALTACATAPVEKPPEDIDQPTSLRRFDGSFVSVGELQHWRQAATSAARVQMLLDRELRDQGAERRDADILMSDLSTHEGAALSSCREFWLSSQRMATGTGREIFGEKAIYTDITDDAPWGPRGPDLREEITRLLSTHADRSPAGQLLAGWRHFAPEVSQRGDHYLSSTWIFDLAARGDARVELRDSLVGPFERCAVVEADDAYMAGAPVLGDGYSVPRGLYELVAPGTGSPVASTIDALSRASRGERAELPVLLDEYVTVDLSAADREFLLRALHGLAQGHADVATLPLNCRRVEVTFSYLVERNEARATLVFARSHGAWTLNKFVYEPAAATVMRRGGARLDLTEMVAVIAAEADPKMISAPRRR